MSNAMVPTENVISEEPSEAARDAGDGKVEEAARELVDGALELGRLWARHGLTLGKMALETSAVSLGTTARMLSNLADAIAPERAREPRDGERAD